MSAQPFKTTLIIEKHKDELWGRVKIKGNLIIDSAKSIESLKKRFKKLILQLEDVEIEDFDVSYDLTTFFNQYSFLNIADIAKRAGINPAVMRQYVSGNKFPSEERVQAIQNAMKVIGKELSRINLHKPQRREVA